MLKNKGIILLESLVALTILAIFLSIILPLFSNGFKLVDDSQHKMRALLLAEAKLEEYSMALSVPDQSVELPATEGESVGFRWNITAEPYLGQEIEKRSNYALELHKVAVVVEWGNERSVELNTLAIRSSKK